MDNTETTGTETAATIISGDLIFTHTICWDKDAVEVNLESYDVGYKVRDKEFLSRSEAIRYAQSFLQQ